MSTKKYTPTHRLRVLTATSLFDGHDASINIMRRLLQATGAEVIHIGHNRSAEEIVQAAVAEDVQAIALTSYQGGHMEFFTYIYDLLKERKSAHIKLYGGGGGTILPEEVKNLQDYGIAHIYLPEDGRKMGLQGMINHMLQGCDVPALSYLNDQQQAPPSAEQPHTLAWRITQAESAPEAFSSQRKGLQRLAKQYNTLIIGFTGTGGAGKSSLLDELLYRYLPAFSTKRAAILSIDPSRQKTGGALLGDRLRMNTLVSNRLYMRSMATRSMHALPTYVDDALLVLQAAGFDLIFFESAGIGQADAGMAAHTDLTCYVMTPEYGAATQLEKINMLDYADFVALNKADKRGAEDALRDVQKQYQRNHQRFSEPLSDMPIFATTASQFNNQGVNSLFFALMQAVMKKKRQKPLVATETITSGIPRTQKPLIPMARVRYLSEIAALIRTYNKDARTAAEMAQQTYALHTTLAQLPQDAPQEVRNYLTEQLNLKKAALNHEHHALIADFPQMCARYREKTFSYQVRGKHIEVDNYTYTLAGTPLPKIVPPRYTAWGDILHWCLQEHFPGTFPYTAGIYPFHRTGETTTRMFAGEGSPERTNMRFHYLSKNMSFARLSTAFDSVTLYGEDPADRLDIYGKIGNSGVSIATLDDVKKLYSGFELAAPSTSVSMTINGPASAICAFFMQAAIDQQCEIYLQEQGQLENVQQQIADSYRAKDLSPPVYAAPLPHQHNQLGLALLGANGASLLPKEVYARIRAHTLSVVRGTVQADILKEDQAQNTCIFSTEFALRIMGDMQAYFIKNGIGNFYSVSISGYHIAEAGANPITQLAFTLANGFTYVEYYLAKGMSIDDFVSNLSFFFSNGLDAEYAVIGRVARRIWAKTMRYRYGASKRGQMLRYHIQTSGRSLHAQEIDFNDIRTTLQALYALYDSCNSLHTNAYDEAITTPTEASVRRALAVQLIINQELGTIRAENFLQGSFVVETLTDLVEEAVLAEFDRLTDRGGVLGAMESMYQRSKIQEESLYYETRKNTGTYPIIGVNTFISDDQKTATSLPKHVIRATDAEKKQQIKNIRLFQAFHKETADQHFLKLQQTALQQGNLFQALMDAAPYCTLGQISGTLYAVGGRYRRNM